LGMHAQRKAHWTQKPGRAAGRRKEQSDARRTPRMRIAIAHAAPDLPRGAGDGLCVELSDRSTNRRYGRIRCRDRGRLVQWALSVTCPGSAPDDAPSSHTIGLSSDRRGQSCQGNARAGSAPGSSPDAAPDGLAHRAHDKCDPRHTSVAISGRPRAN
jgi:hypothetical protein